MTHVAVGLKTPGVVAPKVIFSRTVARELHHQWKGCEATERLPA
jgi:hypothetical protein